MWTLQRFDFGGLAQADLSITLSEDLGHKPMALAKWIITDIQELSRQQKMRDMVSKQTIPDIATNSIQRVFKEAFWGEILHFLCIASDQQAKDFNRLLVRIVEEPRVSPMCREDFVNSDLFDWVFKEAFTRQDIHAHGEMDAQGLRALALYVSFAGQLDLCEKSLDAALGSVKERYNCERAIAWFKRLVGGCSGMKGEGGNCCTYASHMQYTKACMQLMHHSAQQHSP